MKYHYKSPEEVQQYLSEERAKSSSPYRSRTFWIILLDIVIIVIVIVAYIFLSVIFIVLVFEYYRTDTITLSIRCHIDIN